MNQARLFGPGAFGQAEASLVMNCPQPRTALPVRQGIPRHLTAHLQRLEAGAAAMGEPVDWLLELQEPIETWLRATDTALDMALRLVLHPTEKLLAARLEPLPVTPQPYRLVWRPHPLQNLQNSPLTVHKGLSGPWGNTILEEARRSGAEDALLFWSDGDLAETALAAVGVELDGVLCLPWRAGRVASLAERLDLPVWAAERGWQVECRRITQAHAREGRLWCMNALRGIWPATLL